MTYELATPHPYNLRQPVRWSSTPLPLLGAQAGSGATPALVKAASSPIFSSVVSGPPIVEIVDFRKRLEVLDQQQDSGESLCCRNVLKLLYLYLIFCVYRLRQPALGDQ